MKTYWGVSGDYDYQTADMAIPVDVSKEDGVQVFTEKRKYICFVNRIQDIS
jgi:hypothetical protein